MASAPRLRDCAGGSHAGGAGPCASKEAPAAGSRLEAWDLLSEVLAVHSLERSPGGPGGHELRVEVGHEDTLCTLSRQRPSFYLRTDSANSRWADSMLGLGAVLEGAARAAGLPVLRRAALRAGMRELRFSPGGSGRVWQPIPLLRLIEWPRTLTQ